MPHSRTLGTGVGGPLAAAVLVAACGCGPSPITAARIEGAIAPTFGNLVHVQLSRIGLPPVDVSEITVTASCRKLAPGSGAGAGNWVCVLDWHGPNRQSLRDTYDLSVGTDGCYSATVDGTEAGIGGPTVTGADAAEMRNLLYTFEGCFDTT
jgi:hypothetical protein